jgi:outer membrane protein insertion porin family
LKKIMKTKEGSVFNIPVLNRDLKAITEFYNKKGYVFSGVMNMETKDLGQYIKIYINEVKVGKISIKGNTKTRDYVIKREVSLKPGDYFSSIELMRTMRRLMNLGFFSKVKPDYKFDPNDKSKINLTIEVKEQKTGSASFGGGYSSANGLVGFLEVKQNNFRGKGQKVALKFETGGVKTYQISFFDPYFWHKTSFGISVYKTKVRRDYYSDNKLQATYDDERTGEYLTFGRRTGRTTTTSVKFINENVKVTPVYNPDNTIAAQDNTEQTLSVTVTKDTRDNVFKPSAGRYDAVTTSFTGGFLKGKDSYQKYIITLRRYGRLNRKFRTAARVMLGFTNLTGGELPVYEEYGVGGPYTLRGFYTREFTGDHLLLGNFELRYDINDKFTAIGFVDSGDAWGRTGNEDMDLKTAVGFGIMFNSPMGPIRIDYGKPVSESGRSSRTSFSMGTMF